MWINNLLANKVLEQYDQMAQALLDSVTSIDTGDAGMDADLIRSASVEFCRDWIRFSRSYKEAVEHDSDRVVSALEEFNGNVEGAVKLIALQRKLKDKSIDRSGVNAPAYKHFDMEAIKADYLSGCSIAELVSKYNISRPTLVKRLKELGVFRDSRLK